MKRNIVFLLALLMGCSLAAQEQETLIKDLRSVGIFGGPVGFPYDVTGL